MLKVWRRNTRDEQRGNPSKTCNEEEKGKKPDKKNNSKTNSAEPYENGRTYGIDDLKLGETSYDHDSDY